MGVKNALFTGLVYHKRHLPKPHEFSHRVFFILFSLKDLQQLKNHFFSINRWNLLSFWIVDHGNKKGHNLVDWAQNKLKSSGINEAPTEITLMTFPRVLGYVFNPVSFWFCWKGENLLATIAEVNNTFGGTESYVISSEDLKYNKTFHVSPFFKIEGYYKFRFQGLKSDRIAVSIDYFKDNTCYLETQIQGTSQDLNSISTFKTWISHPLMSFAVVFWIHWQALILYIKRTPFFGKKGI